MTVAFIICAIFAAVAVALSFLAWELPYPRNDITYGIGVWSAVTSLVAFVVGCILAVA